MIGNQFEQFTELNIFGLDLLICFNTNKYYLIDCNYFPGINSIKGIEPSEELNQHMVKYFTKLKYY